MEEQNTNQISIISSAESLQAVTAAEIDQQIATAHKFPRNVKQSLENMKVLALMDEETAADCFYHLERQGTIIEGPSIRLAEIAATCWGNLRFATRVVANDGRMVTVEAVAHDLESNVASCQQQVRSIVTKYGKTYSPDMQVMTINAASSVARRNAIYNVVPKAYINKLVEMCKEYVKGAAKNDLRDRVQKVVKAFAKYGVTAEMICEKMKISNVGEITSDMLVSLVGIGNALKDGAINVQDEFPQVVKTEKPEAQPTTAAEKAKAILNKRKGMVQEKAPEVQQTNPVEHEQPQQTEQPQQIDISKMSDEQLDEMMNNVEVNEEEGGEQ